MTSELFKFKNDGDNYLKTHSTEPDMQILVKYFMNKLGPLTRLVKSLHKWTAMQETWGLVQWLQL